MKKLICMILALAMMASVLVGCGEKTPAPDATTSGGDNSVVATEGKTETPTEAQVVDAELSEDDFATESLGDGTCRLMSYFGDAKVVKVPGTIRGETVTKVAGVGTEGITKVILPDSVESIEYNAFGYCPDLTEIELGKGLKSVDYFAFNGCSALKSLTFPDGMTAITGMPFGMCGELKEVFIPASVTDIPGGILLSEMCPNAVIVTPAGSVAEQVANDAGIPVRNP